MPRKPKPADVEHQTKVCESKQYFHTRTEVERAAKNSKGKKRSYSCEICGGYHLKSEHEHSTLVQDE